MARASDTTITFMRHRPDGEAYALEIDVDRVVGVCGPLRHDELYADFYNFDHGEDLDWAIVELERLHFATIGH